MLINLSADGAAVGVVIGLVIVIGVILGLIISCIKIVPQATTFIIERLGTYRTTWETGFHMKVPFIDRVAKKISLKEKVADFAPQAVITKDTYNESTGNGETVYDDNVASHKKCYSNSPASNWTRFYQLLKKAGEACKEVCPNAKIILHTERVATKDYLTSYYQKMKDNGVNFDIMGLSYYPYFHGGLDQLEKSLSQLEKDHSDKDIMIVETNYYYVWQPAKKIKKEDKGIDYDFSSTWPITPAGQQAFTKALIEKLNSHSKVIGLYWWMMEACENGLDWGTKRVTDGWCNTSLFNDSNTSDTGYPAGKVMPAISELKNFLGSESGISSLGADKVDDSYWYSLDGRRMNSKPQAKGIYLNNGKKIIINEK